MSARRRRRRIHRDDLLTHRREGFAERGDRMPDHQQQADQQHPVAPPNALIRRAQRQTADREKLSNGGTQLGAVR
ncbi:MAG: hypothetical protein HRU75_11045 [Planctomycetia bacterium]|nr:MAG: hypothetical protein HRU75_11045 [Planctomycetia bacterium]